MRRVLPIMGDQNSRIEILLGVIRNLLDDIATMIENSAVLRETIPHTPQKECDRDYRYVASRTRSEGLSFLTVQMPRLGKWYDSNLSSTCGELIVGFKPYVTSHGRVQNFSCPLVCRMLAYVIHCESGLHPDHARLIRAYRSLFYLFYKLEVPFTDEQLTTALHAWKQNELELEEFEYPAYFDRGLTQAREIIAGLVTDEGLFREIEPRHGPGAVAGGEDNEEKWETASYIESLHRVYPRYDLYFGFRSAGRVSPLMAAEYISFVRKSGRKEAHSRLLFVPKDSRGPRTISCEPKELMFVQQGIARNLMRLLELRTHHRINFENQSINAGLALVSSQTGSWATIDLKDASDRVSVKLVELLMPEWTLKFLHATRSSSTILPDGSLFEGHRKYAPMGSALCFPIESLLFWALAVSAGINSGLSAADAMASTYVYGDDIIIKPEVFNEMLKVFSSVGLKISVEKSFVDGPFRESCGTDAFNGSVVTPFKIKKDLSRRSHDGNLATAVCKYASTCFALDYRKTGEYLFSLVNGWYPGVIRYHAELGCLSVIDPLAFDIPNGVKIGWDSRSCRSWVEGWVLSTPRQASNLSGLARLLKSNYGYWEEHDPSVVAVLRSAKIRKRKVLVDW